MKKLILFLMLLFTVNAFGYSTAILDLEDRLERRVKTILKPFDSNALVYAKVKFTPFTGSLPGTAYEVSNLTTAAGDSSIDIRGIAQIEVSILSSIDLPSSLKDKIEKTVSHPALKVKVGYSKLHDDYINQLEKVKKADFKNTISRYAVSGGAGVLAIFLILISLIILNRRSAQKSLSNNVGRIVTALNDNSLGGGGKGLTSDINESTSHGIDGVSEENDQNDIQMLSDKSIEALMSDCYWCEKDQYAAWLWRNLNPTQKMNLVKTWKYGNQYVKTLVGLQALHLDYHSHPYYLNPIAISLVSQGDLSDWLKNEPSGWQIISPMRQETSKLNLEEKISCIESEPKALDAMTIPPDSQQGRAIQVQAIFGTIDLEDENKILENPEMVPDSLKASIPTLVWLAQIETEPRSELLSRLNAEEVATAWIGPEAVLEKISEVLPERKKKIVESYRERIKPSRRSEAFKYLVRESLLLANQQQDEAITPEEEEAS